jgi:uncharacterized protein YbjT (DUF2867 family)
MNTLRRRLILLLLVALPLAASAAAAATGGSAPGPAGARVLVFGASGQLGAEICRALVAAGYRVTAFVRPGSDRQRLAGLRLDYATGDLQTAVDVERVLTGGDFAAVIDASARGRAGNDFYPTAMRHIVAAALAHGRPRVVLHGSVGAGDNIRQFPQAPFGPMAATLAAKGEAERLLAASGLAYVIIRNGILAPDGTPATGKASLSDNDRLMRTVTRTDLARLTVECLQGTRCDGRVWHAVDESLPFPERYR